MKKSLRLLVLLFFTISLAGAGRAEDAKAPDVKAPSTTTGAWLEVDIGVIGTASEDILNSAIAATKESGLAGLVIRLDTPGGALENTRAMVKTIMASDFPIMVWVGPSGSRAGSAGAFLTLAAHVAAMAPGTNIGASHPVSASGEDVGDSEMDRKITNDTVAFIESVAKARGRNVDMARSFVETSVSITDQEALDNKVIDYVAKDLDQLFEKANDRVITLASGATIVLATKGATRVTFEPSLRQKLLGILSNPNLFYLLFLLGLIGIGYELTHPGIFLPGVVGGISLILALIATSVLPISYGAAALILVGVGLLVAEAFVTSFGALGIGGLVAFVLGSVFLVDPHNEANLRVSWMVIAPGAVTIAIAFIGLGYLILRTTKGPKHSGREALVGQSGIVLQDFVGNAGQIRVSGSIWSAVLDSADGVPVQKGDRVAVKAIDGLTLRVARLV